MAHWITKSFRKRFTLWSRFEKAAENLPDYLPADSTCLLWSLCLVVLLPELYAELPCSLRRSPAQPGTFERIRRYKLRAKKRLSIFNSKDGINGTEAPKEPQPAPSFESGQDSLFDLSEEEDG